MITKIKKRNGTMVDFDKNKITIAIFKAAQSVGGNDKKTAENISQKVVKFVEKMYPLKIPGVEDIQDVVEKVLIEEGHAKTAKAYILYREQHKNLREMTKLLKDIFMVEDYIKEADWKVKENSNMTFSLQGLNIYITQEVISNYWLNSIYPTEIAEAHNNGIFHIHDLGTLGPYCVGWDLKDLLISGFKGVRGKIESKPAKHLRVALSQANNYMYTLQGEAAGAQAFSSFDTLLAPFIKYDNLDYNQVKQCLQEFMFGMNVPTRVGFQTPFTNVTLDLVCPDFLKDQNIIIGGKPQKEKYSDFQKEMDIFNTAFAETIMDGDAGGRPFTFPIPTYNITKEFDWDNKNYDKIWEMTAKYGIPYFANFINSEMKSEDAMSMCCRLRLDKRELSKKGGGLFGANPLTGSIGVVTINMGRIGFLAKDDTEFFELLKNAMELAKESLVIKKDVLEKFTEVGLYPYSKFYLRNVKEASNQYWSNHFCTIGLIGMNDSVLNLLGENIAEPKGLEFSVKVLDFMRNTLSDYQEETGNIFNLEATPAEGASYRLAKLDKETFPEMKFYNLDKNGKGNLPYYTNSTHLPVGYTDDIFEALKLQESLQTKYTGGTVLHGFIGESMPSIEATKKLVKTIATNFSLPYYTITPTFSICPSHGFVSGKHDKCPECEKKCEIWSRPVGYLRPVEHWHEGKQAEFEDRKTYDQQLTIQEMKPKESPIKTTQKIKE